MRRLRRKYSGPLVLVALLALFAAMAVPASAAGTFTDDDGSIFEDDIEWIADRGITNGCNAAGDEFCPDDDVTRGQMAAFISRALGLTAGAGDDLFTDDDGSIFEDDIDRIGTAGITLGCNSAGDEFCPNDNVTRGQLAAFIVRAYELSDNGGGDLFTDDDGSIFEDDIDRIGTSRVTLGCNAAGDEFCPNDNVNRGQMAAFLRRSAEGVQLQILAINDFHGNIATSSSSFDGVGRADFLAANMRAAEDGVDNSIIVSAGDLIGASPLISALFHDEPTIEAMNLIGLDINGVGNHEFDEGSLELLRMANGGTHPVDGDFGGDVFEGADFSFLAANVEVTATGETLFAPYEIRRYDGVDVAFIGMTLEGTPTIVTQAGVAGLTFTDEIDTVNALVPELQALGVEAIVVLVHEGGFSDGGDEGDDCVGGLTGPLATIVAGFDSAVDLVIAGHVNDEFVCEHNGMWVTMADNRGRLFTDIDVFLDRKTGDMTIDMIDNVPNDDSGTPAADLTALIDFYDGLSAPLADVVIGTITSDLTETETAAGESALGDVIADAQLASTEGVGVGEAVVAFMNPGGIREDMLFVASGSEADGEVTFGEAFATQPFGNSLITMSLTGTQIDTLLEQQWVGQTSPRILQVSDGFTYTWSDSAADGSKVDITSIMIDGVAIVAGDTYRVTVNSFLADGGDNFVVLSDGTDRLGGEIDLDALVTYFGVNSPITPDPAPSRITMIP